MRVVVLLGLMLAACQSDVSMTTKTESFLVTNTTPDSVGVGLSTSESVYGGYIGPGYDVFVRPDSTRCVRPSPVALGADVWLVGDTSSTGASLNVWYMPSIGSWVVTVTPDSIHAAPGPGC